MALFVSVADMSLFVCYRYVIVCVCYRYVIVCFTDMSLFVSVADIEVACTKYEGVDAVKRALRKGLELSTEAMPIKVGTV